MDTYQESTPVLSPAWVLYSTLSTEVDENWPAAKKVWLKASPDTKMMISALVQSLPEPRNGIIIEDKFASELEQVQNVAPTFSVSRDINAEPPERIAFMPASDTVAKTFIPVIRKVSEQATTFVYTPPVTHEGAGGALKAAGITYRKFSLWRLMIDRPDILLIANDWSGEAKYAIALGRILGYKTVCLQESIIDLVDPSIKRMQWADFVMLMGVNTVGQLARERYFITGNPRYEKLHFELPVEGNECAFINCNFTYGVEEDQRFEWLTGVVNALEDNGFDYIISQHPRDRGDLSAFSNVMPSGAALVHNQLKSSSLIISRFSSILHEGLMLGKQGIYYNPHDEVLGYDFHFDDQVLHYCKSNEELSAKLNDIRQSPGPTRDAFRRYLALNCHIGDETPSNIITHLLLNLPPMPSGGIPLNIFQGLFYRIRYSLFLKKQALKRRAGLI